MFLYEKMPKMKLTDPLRLRQIYMPSDQEISKWTRYIKAIERPMSIMDDLVAGVLTPESVDAVRTIYPDVYAKMGITLMEKVQASDKPLTMQQRVQLATFLGMPTSIAMNPQFLQMLQQNTGGLNQEQQSNQKTVLESDVAGRTMSATNSVIYRE
jgi:hypothetical protein